MLKQVNPEIKIHRKRIEFNPLGVYLMDYNTELTFANPSLAEEFLEAFENWENSQKEPHEQRCLEEKRDYRYMPVTIYHDLESAFNQFFNEVDEEADSHPSLFDDSGLGALAGKDDYSEEDRAGLFGI